MNNTPTNSLPPFNVNKEKENVNEEKELFAQLPIVTNEVLTANYTRVFVYDYISTNNSVKLVYYDDNHNLNTISNTPQEIFMVFHLKEIDNTSRKYSLGLLSNIKFTNINRNQHKILSYMLIGYKNPTTPEIEFQEISDLNISTPQTSTKRRIIEKVKSRFLKPLDDLVLYIKKPDTPTPPKNLKPTEGPPQTTRKRRLVLNGGTKHKKRKNNKKNTKRKRTRKYRI